MNATAVADIAMDDLPPPASETTAGAAKAQTVADLMSPAVGVFGPQVTVRRATDALREQVKTAVNRNRYSGELRARADALHTAGYPAVVAWMGTEDLPAAPAMSERRSTVGMAVLLC